MNKLFAIVPFRIGLLMVGSITGLAAQDPSAPAPRATISNRLPRLGTDGTIVDAHDGCLQKFGDRYYLYGTGYGTTDGFNKNTTSNTGAARWNSLPTAASCRSSGTPTSATRTSSGVLRNGFRRPKSSYSTTYGDLASRDPARIRDVKTKVEQALRKGDGRFTASAIAEGDDPRYGTVKTLKVNYRLADRPAEFAGTDPETADLLEQE